MVVVNQFEGTAKEIGGLALYFRSGAFQRAEAVSESEKGGGAAAPARALPEGRAGARASRHRREGERRAAS